MRNKVRKIHMVGIAGSGMSGIAEVLLNLGYEVSGSDLADNETVARLKSLGAKVFKGHQPGQVGQAQVVVKSSAVVDSNPEIEAAREQGIPVIPRAEMLAELMRLKTGIAIAGTHGKTTTTSLAGTVFLQAGLEPTVIIGGRLNCLGSNACLGRGEYLIAEADESDGSFLCLFPIMNVVTNVDADHLDHYSDLQEIEESFVSFMNKIPFYGLNVVCGDDPVLQGLLPRVKRPVVTYGLGKENDLRARIVELGEQSVFDVIFRGQHWGRVKLSQPGQHNVLNGLAVIGIAIQAGIANEQVIQGLESFAGVGRRLERVGQARGILVLDDYGHHPTEIKVTLDTLKTIYPGRRLVVVFQPHRFSRTKALYADFCKAFSEAGLLLVNEIYPASEDPIPGVNGAGLAQGIQQFSKHTEVVFVQDLQACCNILQERACPGDVVLTLGAGDIWKVGRQFVNFLQASRNVNDLQACLSGSGKVLSLLSPEGA